MTNGMKQDTKLKKINNKVIKSVFIYNNELY